MQVILQPDDVAEWKNIAQLMYHLRLALTCSMCGNLVSRPYTPLQEPCHCVCEDCRNENTSRLQNNCVTCRHAFQNNGFESNSNLDNTTRCFATICRLLVAKEEAHKWFELVVDTQNGPITFGELIEEGCNSSNAVNGHNLSDKFRKRVKEKEHHCRCGSGAKKSDGKSSGALTCLGQRCACYKQRKGCVNCKCTGCKNSFGTSSNRFHGQTPNGSTTESPETTTPSGL